MSSVIIVGAGITGPTAALTLARMGHDVTVYEQRPSDGLHSAGILGITERNWRALLDASVDLSAELPNRTYRDLDAGTAQSPFHFMMWTDMHDAITRAAYDSGAGFKFQTRANAKTVRADYVIDAGGIVSAAHRGLPSRYIGQVIYRGVSRKDTVEAFTTYKLPNKFGFLDIGETHNGASWAFGVKRPRPAHLGTTFTDTPPCEAADLPDDFRKVVYATPEIMVLPQSTWTVANAMHNPGWSRFTLGDSNGPVRPITTSGANLGIQAGLAVPQLLNGSEATAQALLRRRAYAIDLGLRLRGPEIGGWLEDPEFDANQRALYGD